MFFLKLAIIKPLTPLRGANCIRLVFDIACLPALVHQSYNLGLKRAIAVSRVAPALLLSSCLYCSAMAGEGRMTKDVAQERTPLSDAAKRELLQKTSTEGLQDQHSYLMTSAPWFHCIIWMHTALPQIEILIQDMSLLCVGRKLHEYAHDCSTAHSAAKASEKARGLAKLIRQEFEHRTDGEPVRVCFDGVGDLALRRKKEYNRANIWPRSYIWHDVCVLQMRVRVQL